MKNRFLLLLIIVSFFSFADDLDDIKEMTIDETKDYAIEQLNAIKNSNLQKVPNTLDPKVEEKLKEEEKKQRIEEIESNSTLSDEEKLKRIEALETVIDAPKKVAPASAKHSITVSLFYPFFMGSANEKMVNIAYSSDRPKVEINGGIDFFMKFVLVDYLLINGGFSWGGSFGYKDDGTGQSKSGNLFSLINFRAGLGGIYPIYDWFSVYGGLNIGYMHTSGGSYMEAISSTYKNALVSMFVVQPFIGMDFEIAESLALSFKFDYAYGISGVNNGLKTNQRETVHYPAIYLGIGFLF